MQTDRDLDKDITTLFKGSEMWLMESALKENDIATNPPFSSDRSSKQGFQHNEYYENQILED